MSAISSGSRVRAKGRLGSAGAIGPAAIAALSAVSACHPDPGTRVEEREDVEVGVYEAEIRDGLSEEIAFEAPAGAESLLLEIRGERGMYYLSQFTTPSDVELIEGGGFVTRAARELPGMVDWLYPNTPERTVEPGEYRIILRAEELGGGDHVSSEDIEVRVYSKSEPSESGCGLHLDFLVDEAAVSAEHTQRAVDGLVERALPLFRQVEMDIIDYQTQRIDLHSSDFDVDEANWRTTTESIEHALAQAREEGSARSSSLRVIVARSLAGAEEIAGYSMGLPGPFDAERPNSAVLLATEHYADGEGQLDLDGLSTTLAHEIGHYLGLYHTSEPHGDLHDPIPDTPRCEDAVCDAEFLDNVMSPGEGARRYIFTEGQGEVMKRHPLCIPREVSIEEPEPQSCELACDPPQTCSVWRGDEACRRACDPDDAECPEGEGCAADDRGTYVCVPEADAAPPEPGAAHGPASGDQRL